MKKPRRATLVLWIVVVAIALVATSLWVDEGPLWRWANYKTITSNVDSGTYTAIGNHPLQGLSIVSRWRHWSHNKMYYSETGMLVWEIIQEDGSRRETNWRFDGTVPLVAAHQGWKAGPGIAGLSVRDGFLRARSRLVRESCRRMLEDFISACPEIPLEQDNPETLAFLQAELASSDKPEEVTRALQIVMMSLRT